MQEIFCSIIIPTIDHTSAAVAFWRLDQQVAQINNAYVFLVGPRLQPT